MITYPVPADSIWVFHEAETGNISRERSWPVANGGKIPNISADITPLRVIREPQPPFDALVERVERADPVIDLAANEYRYGWQVVALTPDEAAAAQDARQQVVKAEASRRIEQELSLPIWRQNNLQTHALLTILPAVAGNRALTTAEQEALQPLIDSANAALAVRTRSDELEDQVIQMSQADWNAFDITDEEHWA